MSSNYTLLKWLKDINIIYSLLHKVGLYNIYLKKMKSTSSYHEKYKKIVSHGQQKNEEDK